jgi:hypothetical protein
MPTSALKDSERTRCEVGHIAQLRRIAELAAASVRNPAWSGICDEDVALEIALRDAGFLPVR